MIAKKLNINATLLSTEVGKQEAKTSVMQQLSAMGLKGVKQEETAAIILNNAAKKTGIATTIATTGANVKLLVSIKQITAGLLATAAAWLTTPMGIIVAFTGAIMIAVNAYKNYKQTIEDNNRLIAEKAKATKEELNSLNELIAKYKKLKTSGNYDESTRTQIVDVQSQITNLVGEQANNLDLVNNKLDEELIKLNEIERKRAITTRDAMELAKLQSQKIANEGIAANNVANLHPKLNFGTTDVRKALLKSGIYRNYDFGDSGLPSVFLNSKSVEEQEKILEEWRTAFLKLGEDGLKALVHHQI